MKRRKHNEIISIFGEMEEFVARQMMAEGKGVTLLAPTRSVTIEDIPESVRYNARGQRARMVIVLPPQVRMEFERRLEDARA